MSANTAPAPAIRKGAKPTASTAPKASVARPSTRFEACHSRTAAKNGTATTANCLRRTATASSDRRGDRAPPGQEREGQHHGQHGRRVGRAEPRCANGEGIGRQRGSQREARAERTGKRERHGHGRQGQQRHQDPVVPEGPRDEAPRRGAEGRSGKVGEVTQGDLGLPRGGRDTAVEAVEALEPRVAVVVAVRALTGAHERTGDVDLLGRVVDVEPRRCPLAQARLEHDARQDEQRHHRDDHRHRE